MKISDSENSRRLEAKQTEKTFLSQSAAKPRLSVAIITFNEEDNIARTLEAVRGLADEIVLLDSFSTDKTCEIAESFGAKIFYQEFKGFLEQKNSVLDKCQGDWILSIDADEVPGEELKASILKALDSDNDINGYTLNRRTFYMGKLMKYSWQPDRKLRLVRRAANPRGAGYNPHSILVVDGKTAPLKGDLIHYSYRDFSEHMLRTITYARRTAESYYDKGKKAGAAALFLRPAFAFFKSYILQRGILDGMPGLIAALSSVSYVYMKYAFLWELNKTHQSATIKQNKHGES